MDAREYMARKGIEPGRDQEKPNTLEEKAWSRAREAGDHRPRAGTPHDWEDWERHHADLAEGAEEIIQKIDHEAHSAVAQEHGGSAVEQFTPPAVHEREPPYHDAASQPHTASGTTMALTLLAVLMPPLAVALGHGGDRRTGVNLLLTLMGWLPGVGHALWWLHIKRK